MRNLSPPEQKPLPTLLKPRFLQHTGNVLQLKQLMPPLKFAQKFADSATQAARPQLKMMEEQNQHLRTAVEGMNILSSQNALMVTKITHFTGNPRDYRRFIANFTHNVANMCTDDSIRLNYLIKHCQGDAKSLIEDCVLLQNGGYKTAKDLLETEYWQKTDIAADHLSFLKSGE